MGPVDRAESAAMTTLSHGQCCYLFSLLQEFTPSPGSLGKSISIGEFARDILLDQVSQYDQIQQSVACRCAWYLWIRAYASVL